VTARAPSFGRVLRHGLLIAPVLTVSLLAISPGVALGRSAYVAMEETNSVKVFDTQTNQVTGAPIAVGKEPAEIAITPNGKTAYVTNFGSSSVSVIDTQTNQTVGPAIKVGKKPVAIAITPDGTRAYIANEESKSVSVIDTATNQVIGSPITIGAEAGAIAISPDGTRAYVADFDFPSTVLTIDTATNQLVGLPITVEEGADAIAITPDGRTAYVANLDSFDVTPIDLQAHQAGPPIPVGDIPVTIAITPNGRTAYVADFSEQKVSVIDTTTNQPGMEIPFKGARPNGIAITPDGGTAYVGEYEPGGVFTVDTATSKVVGAPIDVGAGPAGIAITPDQPPIASFSAPAARPGVPITLDATSSNDPDGRIASYRWEFGDGQTVGSAGSGISHTYGKPGSYTATLTATDNEGCSVAEVFTGQTAYCNAGPAARTTRTVTVAYPGVRLKCPKGAKPAGCRFKLVAVKKKGRRKPQVETAVAKAKVKAGQSKIVSLKPKMAFAARVAAANQVVVKETVTIAGSARTRFRTLKIVR
jgi:YVTN family beta-propeller protein